MDTEKTPAMVKVDAMYLDLLDALGPEALAEAIDRALSYDEKRDLYPFLLRAYDVEGREKYDKMDD